MKGLIRYLFGRKLRDKLPRLHHTLAVEFEPTEVDPEIELVLMIGLVRDPHEARKLMEKYEARSAYELLAKLPPSPPVDWRRRLNTWIRHLEGSYAHDPHGEELKKPHNYM